MPYYIFLFLNSLITSVSLDSQSVDLGVVQGCCKVAVGQMFSAIVNVCVLKYWMCIVFEHYIYIQALISMSAGSIEFKQQILN